jgi:plastocyanin
LIKKTPTVYCLCLLTIFSALAYAQAVTVTADVALVSGSKKGKARTASNVVLWLTPAGNLPSPNVPASPASNLPQLVQRNKSFEPHVLVVPVGSVVEFPNRDPFFHNVFSLFEGKRFDLGLYEAGTTRNVVFDKPGISYIFCNIHSEMSAVVIAVSSPYYGISDQHGRVTIPNVPSGRYTLRIWYEETLPEQLNNLTREVTISEDAANLGAMRLPATNMPQGHENMYGHDYPPPLPDSPTYERH